MVLDPNVMVDTLVNAAPPDEPAAAVVWADMLIDYMKTATGILPAGFTTAFRDTLILLLDGSSDDPDVRDGMSADGAGLVIIPAAFVAMWGLMIVAPPTFFTGATLITPPPGLGLIAADMLAQAPVNILFDGSGTPPSTGDPDQDTQIAVGNLVLGLPPGTNGYHFRNQGGTFTTPGPVITPIV